jgi:hypothetical protein
MHGAVYQPLAVKLCDILREAFFQTASTLLRNDYLRNLRATNAELLLRPEQALRQLTPLCGLTGASDL